MRIYQILTTMSYGDAVGNDTLAFDQVFRKFGYTTGIYAENIDNRLNPSIVQSIEKMPRLKRDDIVIYHFSTGTKLNTMVAELPCRVIMRYHNITPSFFFEDYSEKMTELCERGRKQLREMRDGISYCLADSEFNKEDLREMGYQCRIDVLPILIPFSDYDSTKNEAIVCRYGNDNYTNVIFTGRITPNKKQEDVIAAFYMYQKHYNPKSRLFLVGNYRGLERYYYRLKDYCKRLNVKNVIFTGHIRFDEMLAYYSVADIFLCQSEHEGFCVPLVEAMHFNVPIVAYDSSAIVGTLGGAGVVLKEKNALETAGVMDYVIKHSEVQKQMITMGQKRLKEFEYDLIEKQLMDYIKEYVGE